MMYPKRKKAEEDLLRVNRALKALSRCNQAIIYIQDENELLNEICHIIVEIGGYRLAWVGYAEDDDYKSVHPVAQVGFEDGYLETLQITWADQERGRGPTGTAIRTGEASIVKNIHENGRFAPWREEAKKRDYASSIAIPLKSEGKTFGAMNIYSAKADAFNEEEVRLLTELADDLAYGISSTRTREARKRAENISQARLRLLEFAISHSMDELLTASLDEIEAMTGSVIGFYHFLEPDQKTLISQNWSTNTLKNMCTAKGKGSHYDIEQAGVWVECIDKGHPVIHNDYASLQNRKGLPEGHAPVIRELVVPVFRGKLIKAIIGVGNKSIDYTENDIEIVSQLGDLSFDIVERKLIAKELQWERDFVKTLIDNAKVIIGVLDMDDRFVLVNPYMEDVTGYKFSELQGKSWIETLFPKPDQMRAKEHFKSVINDWDSSPQTFPIVTKDGSIRSIEWYDSLLKDIEGNTTGLLVIGLDITERKEAEEELTRHRHHLEELVKERSAEIIKINEELREANLRLQEADRLKDVFLASMSHELRTPLNSIIGFTGIMLMGLTGELTEEQKNQLKLVKNSANHLLDLINDLLDISKIEAGKIEIKPNDFNFNEVVEDVLNTISTKVSEKGLTIVNNLESEIILHSDRRRVKQVLMNLAGNAVKFTESGSITITSKITADSNLQVNIQDTGMGIKAEDIKILFLPFQQIDMSSTKEFEGTGLGLYLCKKIVNLLGGDISAKSEFGKGSEFIFTIPLKYEGPYEKDISD